VRFRHEHRGTQLNGATIIVGRRALLRLPPDIRVSASSITRPPSLALPPFSFRTALKQLPKRQLPLRMSVLLTSRLKRRAIKSQSNTPKGLLPLFLR